LEQLEMRVADLKGMKQGHLKLTVITTAKYFVPRLLGPFCQQYPGVDVSLIVTNHQRAIDRLADNQDDLYVMSQLPEHIDVQAHPFLDNPLVVMAPKNHPLAGEKNIPIERLNGEPFIMREPGSGTRKAVQALFEERDVEVRVRLELGSNEAIKQAIAGGLGLSVLSCHTLTPEGDTGELTILDVEGFPIESQWYVVHLGSKQLSIVASTFLDYLKSEARYLADGIIALQEKLLGQQNGSSLSNSTSNTATVAR
jgi:DNA-binding transcriptional LysR family regulator